MSLQIITANELRNGQVIYLNASGQWVDDLPLAYVYDSNKNDIDINDIINTATKNDQVIGIYAIKVCNDGGNIAPVSMKEQIRNLGPTVTPNIGLTAINI